ncbi:DUF1285 domain-containing protein [Permianibacter sp. IMCC34836]|uniref:DUF1285 domain-containing protein n=1 Tax=Permianibacter fluminis TaxID=2738515 RepID=UPI00155723BB|nr:DUF1285 domain-containing protein [Permianibacter fluminis]NQD35836.1 DUF1285 domain-containing protein [Permianibacter fluminis]
MDIEAKISAAKGEPGQWNPPFCGDIDLEIRADGSWWYLGTPIQRPELVKLFARVLRREGDKYFLVTPAEKVGIKVADAAFVITDADILDPALPSQRVRLTSNIDESFELDANHRLEVRGDASNRKPYVHVRNDLWALLSRSAYYRLAADVESLPEPDDGFGIRSNGLWFRLL